MPIPWPILASHPTPTPRPTQVRPDEHILASVNIYTDIINLFMHVLASYLRNSNRD